jgi:hypothetical protein
MQPLPASSSNKPTPTTPEPRVAASRKSPWKKLPPPWSPFYRKHRRALFSPSSESSLDALCAGVDNVEPILTASEPPLEDARAVVEGRGCSLKIPETPTVAPDDVQPEEGGHKEDDDIPEGDGSEASSRDTSYSKHNAGSVEVGKMQQTDRSESGIETRCLDNASSSVAECSGETLAPTTVFASSSRDLGESRPAIVDVSTFTIVEILGKRSSGSGVEYQFELEPLCLPADLVVKAQMGRVHIRRYETGLVRKRRVDTLKVRKRKLSEV